MIQSSGKPENYKGSNPSRSPTVQDEGVFSLCSGGVPIRGAFGRIPGKSIRALGDNVGGAITIYQFGLSVVVQRFLGMEIYKLADLNPNATDFVYDNQGNIVDDNFGIHITQ